MTAYLIVAASFFPALASIVWHLSERRKLHRFNAACEEERRASRLSYLAEDEVTEKRQSFSGFPFAKRHR